jgi:threonyl-tRNA synthetase
MIDVNNKCLRRIMKVRWEDRVSTEELLKQANCRSLSSDVKQRKWKMIGHILRQDRYNLINVAMTWAPEGKRIFRTFVYHLFIIPK